MADLIVIGGGHAGCEAALAAARMGISTLLFTLNIDGIALMACNPSIGGSAKGHLVREIDALGGEMGKCIDDTFLQSRTLNRSKGPSVHALRAQADKQAYQNRMRHALFTQVNLEVRQGEVVSIETENGRVTGVTTLTGQRFSCRAVVVAVGVYLRSQVIIGDLVTSCGPQGLAAASHLSASLEALGFHLRRFKTGTPARVLDTSIDFDQMEPQRGDEPVVPFSFMTHRTLQNRALCYLTYTNEDTHRIIRENLHRAPLYSGLIQGVGPRYCPSIETKVERFADKDRHQLFLEPEGMDSHEWYVQGMSSSLPEDVQWAMYRTVPGLHRCVLTRLAYAIEYDCIDSRALRPTLESLSCQGLFFAGQINGTSGYEEAAAQGILAGMNASLQLLDRPPIRLTRDMGYLGVLVDDLTTQGTDEPYRMMTSRAEHRMTLRQDNADFRLTPISHAAGLAGEDRYEQMEEKRVQTERLIATLSSIRYSPEEFFLAWLQDHGQPRAAAGVTAKELLKRPDITLDDLMPLSPELVDFLPSAREQAEITVKYEGYLARQDMMIRQARAMEEALLPEDTPYLAMDALRLEARQKLHEQRPPSLAAASRIPGVNPADVAVLMVWLERHQRERHPGG